MPQLHDISTVTLIGVCFGILLSYYYYYYYIHYFDYYLSVNHSILLVRDSFITFVSESRKLRHSAETFINFIIFLIYPAQ